MNYSPQRFFGEAGKLPPLTPPAGTEDERTHTTEGGRSKVRIATGRVQVVKLSGIGNPYRRTASVRELPSMPGGMTGISSTRMRRAHQEDFSRRIGEADKIGAK
jgi:hypothetical protein